MSGTSITDHTPPPQTNLHEPEDQIQDEGVETTTWELDWSREKGPFVFTRTDIINRKGKVLSRGKCTSTKIAVGTELRYRPDLPPIICTERSASSYEFRIRMTTTELVLKIRSEYLVILKRSGNADKFWQAEYGPDTHAHIYRTVFDTAYGLDIGHEYVSPEPEEVYGDRYKHDPNDLSDLDGP